MKTVIKISVALSLALGSTLLRAYPLDGYPETGIARVEGARLASQGTHIKGAVKQVPGALLSTEQVDIRLRMMPDFELPQVDADLSAQIREVLGKDADRYGVTVLDLSDLNKPRYAEWRGDYKQNVGSIGKLLVALGFFQALKDAYPNDIDGSQRAAVLKNTMVTADDFAKGDHHKIRVFNPETLKLDRHPMRVGERANQWQFLDWMLSVSSNAAAAMNQRQAMLLRHFGDQFPIPDDEIDAFFKQMSSKEKTALYKRTFWEPISRNGLDINQIRQGSFFTRAGKNKVNGGGNSYATARQLMELTLKLEKGQLVDAWSSTQIKRLLYMTERRIRYASSPVLKDAAVYFKSGSLYSCKEEAGFKCGKYKGNRKNYMNSLAIIESPAEERDLFYVVIVISNVLRKNSAYAHQLMATKIHKFMRKAHPPEPAIEKMVEPVSPAIPATGPE